MISSGFKSTTLPIPKSKRQTSPSNVKPKSGTRQFDVTSTVDVPNTESNTVVNKGGDSNIPSPRNESITINV